MDDDDTILSETTIDRNRYYRERIKHGKGLLDDVHKELSKQLPNDTIGFAAFYIQQDETEAVDGGMFTMSLRTKVIPANITDEFIDKFGERITNFNSRNGLTEQEINEFINQRTNVRI